MRKPSRLALVVSPVSEHCIGALEPGLANPTVTVTVTTIQYHLLQHSRYRVSLSLPFTIVYVRMHRRLVINLHVWIRSVKEFAKIS